MNLDTKINKNKLFLGDCLDILPTLANNSVDMLLVDLPYGTTACHWDSVLPLDVLWNEYMRICKKDAALVFHAAQPFTTTLIQSNIKHFKYEWIWEKTQGTNPMSAKYMPIKVHESILVFSFGKHPYYPIMRQGKGYSGYNNDAKKMGEVYGEKTKSVHKHNPEGILFPRSVLKIQNEKGLHPTQKPVKLSEYLIATYTVPGEIILDNTMGSGTTCLAARNLNRHYIGIEKEEKYFDIAAKRLGGDNFQSSNEFTDASRTGLTEYFK